MKKHAAILLISAAPVFAGDYYVSTNGTDSSSAGSAGNPWKTISYAIGRIHPGDTLHLQAGATFVENVYFAPGKGGTNGAPITLTSDPLSRATLKPATTNNNAIYVYNSDNLTLSNLVFVGQGIGTNTKAGVNFYVDNTRYAGLRFENLDFSGFGSGLVIGGWSGVTNGYRNISVENCRFHHNNSTGFYIYGQYKTSHTNLVVRNCTADNSRAGDGILVNGVTGGLVERCIAHDNGSAGNGRVGIWTYGVDDITIQYCESYNNRTSGGNDGGGFDFDGGTVNSVMQYNYSHGNDGAGLALYQYNGALSAYGPLQGNVIRYNISENDGRRNGYGGVTIWGDNATDIVSTNDIYQNTIYVGGTASNGSPSAIHYSSANIRGVRLRNNLVIAANGFMLLTANSAITTNLALHQGNDWWSMPGTQFQIKYGSTIYSNLPAWRATGNERLGGADVGYNLDPRLAAPGAGNTNGYTLLPDSPLIDAALNLIAAPGNSDFFGNPIPQGAAYDVGAHDTRPTVTVVTTQTPASEYTGATAIFTLSRTGGTMTNLTVTYSLTGTASNGVDYLSLPVALNIPVGATNVTLTVTPIADNIAEGNRTVVLTLATVSLFTSGSPSIAMATILDKPIDNWRYLAFGSNANNPVIAGNLADPDGDGLPNLLEYALGLDPMVASQNGLPSPTLASDDGNSYLTLAVNKNPAATDVQYAAEVCNDLAASSWTNTVTVLQNDSALFKARDNISVTTASKRFMRLRVTIP